MIMKQDKTNEYEQVICDNSQSLQNVYIKGNANHIYSIFIKRGFDIILSLIVMPFLVLSIIIFAPLIKYSDRGSIFYNALRLGYNGKTFIMYKLRTMKVNAPDIRLADGSTYNGEDDPRQTKIGKFLRSTSLDELPQILNVLKGDMSFVGPRPDLPEHIQQYEDSEIEKLNVKPGITGYNQAYFRNTIEWKERLKNDVVYARNISFLFDAKIIVHTIGTLLLRRNIYIKSRK